MSSVKKHRYLLLDANADVCLLEHVSYHDRHGTIATSQSTLIPDIVDIIRSINTYNSMCWT
jgi:hypothetical protein